MAFFVFGKAIALIRVAKGKIAVTRLKLCSKECPIYPGLVVNDYRDYAFEILVSTFHFLSGWPVHLTFCIDQKNQ
jgi:hypothetical protein